MHSRTLAALSGLAFALTGAPVQAAWHSYISKDLGFSFIAPGEVAVGLGTYRAEVAGPRQTVVFKSMEDNIEYKVTVMFFAQAQMDGDTLLGERTFMFQDGKELLMDTFGRVEQGKDAVYGRKMVINSPDDGGRTMGAFYFYQGKLISLEATVLPEHCDYGSPEPARFIDSIAFNLARTEPGAIELKTPAF